MDKTAFARLIDHALLAPDLNDGQIMKGLALARETGCFSACVHPADVATASRMLQDSATGVCSVVGFPLGRQTARIKAQEAEEAFKNGAFELDVVLNVGQLKSGHYNDLQEEIQTIVNATPAPIKIILETCYLTDEEKIAACKIALYAGARFVKTSTGFGPRGATAGDVALLRKTVGKDLGVKAAGGISNFAVFKQMIEAGADRIGTSKTEAILREIQNTGGFA